MTSETRYLYIPVETKVRELHGKFFFAFVAAEKGFDVTIGGQQELHKNIDSFSPGIYVDKSIAETKRNWFRKSRSAGHTMCTWDEEGLVVFDADSHFRLRICYEVLEQTKYYFGWGPSEISTIAERAPKMEHKLNAVGNPRFDMLRPELREFYKEAVDKLHQEYGRILLVNTNFAFANFFAGDEKVKEVYRAYSISEDPAFFDGWEQAQRQSMELFKVTIPELSKRYPDQTIVIRPHPSEAFALWEELAANYPNVIVRGEGNVYEWILSAEALIHFNCTTGIEAFFLDVPAISYRSPGYENFHQPLPNELSLICNSPDLLFNLLDEIKEQGTAFPRLAEDPARMEVAHKFIEGMDGAFASERIVDLLWQIDLDEPQAPAEAEPEVPLIKKIWRRWLRVVRRPDPRDHAYYLHKFPGISFEEAEGLLKKFQSITGRFSALQISQVGQNCYRIIKL